MTFAARQRTEVVTLKERKDHPGRKLGATKLSHPRMRAIGLRSLSTMPALRIAQTCMASGAKRPKSLLLTTRMNSTNISKACFLDVVGYNACADRAGRAPSHRGEYSFVAGESGRERTRTSWVRVAWVKTELKIGRGFPKDEYFQNKAINEPCITLPASLHVACPPQPTLKGTDVAHVRRDCSASLLSA
jgi:hypothetical protein